MEDVRRALAGIGAGGTARAVPPPRAAARAPERPAVAARAATAPGAPVRHVGPPALAVARGSGPPAPPQVRSAAPVPAAAGAHSGPPPLTPSPARGSGAPGTAPHGGVLLRPARRGLGARRPAAGLAAALRTQRRERVAWTHLSRARLAAAWEAVQRAGGPGEADLRLVGVYGPLPVGALEAVALEPDGRIAVRLAATPRAGAPGDVALARAGDGRLVRCDLPYPDGGRGIRPTR
ncbi:MAG: hypothetical protein AB7V62_08500 [Thermoleophilia bacterium]